MESVLVGVDRSDAARRAALFAFERARVNDWRVTLVHVVNWSPYSFQTAEENEQRPVRRQAEIDSANNEIIDPLVRIAETECGLDSSIITTGVRHGRPAETLVDLARQNEVDLIVVGRTGDSNLRAAFFGTTPNRLVQYAHVPVVVVP